MLPNPVSSWSMESQEHLQLIMARADYSNAHTIDLHLYSRKRITKDCFLDGSPIQWHHSYDIFISMLHKHHPFNRLDTEFLQHVAHWLEQDGDEALFRIIIPLPIDVCAVEYGSLIEQLWIATSWGDSVSDVGLYRIAALG